MNNPIPSTQPLLSIFHQGIREILSEDAFLNHLLYEPCCSIIQGEGLLLQNKFSNLAEIQKRMEECLDEKSAQGILVRAGRVAFHPFLQKFGEKFGWLCAGYNLLSPRKRLMSGLELLAQNLYPGKAIW